MAGGYEHSGFRLTLGAGVLSALLLLVSTVSLEWRYFEADLAAPTSDSIVAVFGGVSLSWSETCNKYANTTLSSGIELPAAYICFVRQLNMSDASAHVNLDTNNAAIESVIGVCILACGMSMYILMFAPLKSPDMRELSMQARSVSGILATTANGSTLTVGEPDVTTRALVMARYWHDRILTLVRIEYYIPLLLLPPLTAAVILSALYSATAEAANDVAFIQNHAVMGASTALCMVCLSALLRLAMPRCCPTLLYGGFPRAVSQESMLEEAEDDDTFVLPTLSSLPADVPSIPPVLAAPPPHTSDCVQPEHSVLFVSSTARFLFRMAFLAILACSLASLGSLWWVYSGTKDGVSFEGGLTLGDLRMKSSPNVPVTALVQLTDAIGSLGVFSAPLIAAGTLASLGSMLVCLGYVVNLPVSGIATKLLLWDPFCNARPLVPVPSASDAQAKQQWLLEEDDRAAMLSGLERWRRRPTPTVLQLNATARFSTAAALCFAFAVLVAVIPCLAFDWESYLWVYADILHIPSLQFSNSIGPALILNILAAISCLMVAAFAIRLASQRRTRYREAIASDLADCLDTSRGPAELAGTCTVQQLEGMVPGPLGNGMQFNT